MEILIKIYNMLTGLLLTAYL